MILSPAQWKAIRDAYQVAFFMTSDPNLGTEAKKLAEAAGEFIAKAESIAEREDVVAPF